VARLPRSQSANQSALLIFQYVNHQGNSETEWGGPSCKPTPKGPWPQKPPCGADCTVAPYCGGVAWRRTKAVEIREEKETLAPAGRGPSLAAWQNDVLCRVHIYLGFIVSCHFAMCGTGIYRWKVVVYVVYKCTYIE